MHGSRARSTMLNRFLSRISVAPTYALLWCLLGMVVSAAMSLGVFSSGRITADEGSYLFQSHAFLDGVVRREAPGLESFLKFDMIILDAEKGWLSRYPPTHSLWLMPGVALGWPQLMTAVACGCTLMISVWIGRQLGLPPWLLPLLMILSPFFLFMYGSLLSHTSGLLAATAMWGAYLRGREDASPGWLAVAGLCWSFLFLNRTWTALLLALPFAVDSLWILWKGRTSKAAWIQTLAFAGCAMVGMGLYLGYNAWTTGDAGLATYLFYEPSEGLGFGLRRIQGGARYTIDHTVARGVGFFVQKLVSLDRWLYGIPIPGVTLIAVSILSVLGFRGRVSILSLGVFLIVPLGYIAFWFPGVPDVGPLYLTEVLPFLMTLIAMGVWKARDLWIQRGGRTGWGWGLVALLALSSGWFGWQTSLDLREEHGAGWQAEKQFRALPGKNLIFVDPSLNQQRRLRHYVSLNRRGMDSRVLRIQVTPSFYPVLCAAFPDRTPWIYRLNWDGPELRPYTPPETLGSWRKGGDDARASSEFLFYGWYPLLPPGEYACRFRFQGPEDALPRFDVELMADFGKRAIVRETVQAGEETITFPFRLDTLQMVEPRVTRPADSSLQLLEIEITSLNPE